MMHQMFDLLNAAKGVGDEFEGGDGNEDESDDFDDTSGEDDEW